MDDPGDILMLEWLAVIAVALVVLWLTMWMVHR